MTKHLQLYCIIAILYFGTLPAIAQQVSIDNSVSLQQLIETHLANSCVEISNVSSTVNGNSDGIISYGSFDSGNSSFPLENGIVLSSGDAASGGNSVISNDLSDGTVNWGTDPDIETYLGVGNTINATSIEFDFVALSDNIQFNYLLASEEYFANYPCNSSDGFVFLIREATSTGPYQNIAVVPGSGDPVTVGNIHDQIGTACAASNDQYFDGYAIGDTNYNGRTTVLTASANITPNVQYHVKLIVADQSNNATDPAIDTAVFIEANTFTELELGDDIDTCSNSVTLNGEIQNPLASYTWFRDNTLITGETNATLTTSLSGLYRVEVSINSCVLQDEVNVNIDTELLTNAITPYERCDNDGNGEETFDLSTKNTDVETAIQNLPPNYTISYYLSDNDARNNPSNNISSPISTSSTTIYVRVEDTVNGCLIFGNFDLIVHPTPTVTQPTPLEVCDNDSFPDSITTIDLSQKDVEITGGDTTSVVTYHATQLEASSGANPIMLPYINTNPSETLFVRVVNTLTGCVDASGITLDINVINGNTQINRNTQYIDACDSDHDGFATFDITQVLNAILNGATGFLPPTYHLSYSDAESGSNPISNPQNYTNSTANEEVIFLRLVDDTTGCYAIVPIEVHTNLLLTGTNIPANGFAFCDEDGDGSVDVYLNTLENVIANGLSNISVTFYETASDRDNNSSPIDTSNPVTINDGTPSTLYLAIENGLCSDISEVLLRVNPVITFSQVDPIPYCDTDDDGFTTVDFSTFDSVITGGNTAFNVRYFMDQMEAENGLNQLPQFYDTASGSFYARIENNTTGCHTVNPFEIYVIPAPTVMTPSDILICNNSTSTTSDIRLEDKISEIVSDPSNLIIEFFTDINAAQNFDKANPLGNLDKQNFETTNQTIYARIESTEIGTCFSIVSFDVVVNTIPIIPSITPYQICVDPGTTNADFYLQDKDLEILNGQSGKEVFYFQDPGLTMPLEKTIPYNSNGSEAIYVRVENSSDPNCNATSSFILEIGNNPNYNTNFTNFPPICQSTAGTHTFDLNAKREEIASGSTDTLDIQFYLTYNEAASNADSYLPDQYTSQALQGQFYTRIENAANTCYVIEEVRFTTFPTPLIASATIEPVCDTDYDGSTPIDLNTAVLQIENVRFGDVTISFYADSALSNRIPDNQLGNYPVSNNQTVYVNVETSTGCSDAFPMEVFVNIPPELFTVGTIADCYQTDNTFDLSLVDSYVTHSSNQVTISYHDSQVNAENNTGSYTNKTFNYSSTGNYTIYVRVEDNTYGCPAYTTFNLQIDANPIANTPPDLVACNDDFDNAYEFDLSLNDSAILGSQSSQDFSVYYYNNTISNAENDVNRLDTLYTATDGEFIYARIENNITGCYSLTQFQTIINPLPIIPLEDTIPICLNDLPRTLSADTGNATDTYLWWTGETTSEIVVDESHLGDHWVTVTTHPQNCSYTQTFSLIESEEATIDATATADFTDPNTITVTVSGVGDYQYVLDGGTPQDSNIFNNVSLGPHIVTIIDLNGCTPAETEVFVIDIPKFVTPNNDGYFDTWHIVGISRLPGTLVYIYDRQGKLLKMLPHTSIGWNGTFNGQDMPADDYWFSADIIHDGESFNIKGHFALKR
ncbi:T9SS type B sorting domain-containing protein [Aestuariivivens sediminicola]|uniref:T9SS type B sorting domain-containing protein n=1 Tax=Aestuariivivens sediminicola TaxID=2913560 RepID=UPI001F56FC9D|nr:choice-of-anchor L domain-containing protein [Aestuariivivens sediminicola]